MVSKVQLRKEILWELQENQDKNPRFFGNELQGLYSQGQYKNILGYSPLPGEVDPFPLLEDAHTHGLKVFLPRVESPEKMNFYHYDFENPLSQKDYYGIYSPAEDGEIYMARPEESLLLIPGLAFDLQGHRLGRGRGFYDRFLEKFSHGSMILGISHHFQILEFVPVDPWDRKVHGLVIPGTGLISLQNKLNQP